MTESLLGSSGEGAIPHIISCVRNIRCVLLHLYLVSAAPIVLLYSFCSRLSVKNARPPLPVESLRALCARLDACRNTENDPDSQQYKRKLEAMVDEDDMLAEMQLNSSAKQPRMDIGVKVLSPPAP